LLTSQATKIFPVLVPTYFALLYLYALEDIPEEDPVVEKEASQPPTVANAAETLVTTEGWGEIARKAPSDEL
jgi:hypothetical protein